MNKSLALSITFILSVIIIFSCSKEKTDTTTVDCSTVTNKAFAANVNPIIQATCNIAGCHATGSFNGPGELTNYAEISAAAPFIRTAVLSGKMPQGSTLTTSQKNSIICWIDGGAPNN